MNQVTLCWDCANATGKCRWSQKLKPVKGWTADLMNETASKPYTSYFVHQCPQFVRDAVNGGQGKIQKGSI